MEKVKFEFEGTPYGDGECFCWLVKPSVYEKLTEEEPLFYKNTAVDNRVCLYPDDLFSSMMDSATKRYKIKIEVVEC